MGVESSRRSNNSLEGDWIWCIVWISFERVAIYFGCVSKVIGEVCLGWSEHSA